MKFLVFTLILFILSHPSHAQDSSSTSGSAEGSTADEGGPAEPPKERHTAKLYKGLGLKNIFTPKKTSDGKPVESDSDQKVLRFLIFTTKGEKHRGLVIEDTFKPAGLEEIWIEGAPVVLLVHGWPNVFTKKRHTVPMIKIKNEYIDLGEDRNIIVLDWSQFSQGSMFRFKSPEIQDVGDITMEFVKELKNQDFIKDFGEIHCIGHDLGAHICGHLGSKLEQKENQPLGRITGIDPAGPAYGIFKDHKQEEILDSSDAKFVDVMHCGMGNQGTEIQSGHLDFYPNGGRRQPKCPEPIKDVAGDCIHNRCLELYRASIRHTKYMACPCQDFETYQDDVCQEECIREGDDMVLMGYPASPDAEHGKYYLMPDKPKFKPAVEPSDGSESSGDDYTEESDSEE